MNNLALVQANFSKRAASYDKAGVFQAQAAADFADRLIAYLEQQSSPILSVLELGAGTGFLSERLLQRLPLQTLQITDLSESMLTQCQLRLESCLTDECQISYLPLDFNTVIFRQAECDLMVSSMALQWARDLTDTVARLRTGLKPGGTLAFTTLTDRTFARLQQAFAAAGLAYPGPDLLGVEQIRASCAGFEQVSVEVSNYQVTYASVLEYLRAVQQTGAGNASTQRLTVAQLRKVMAAYESLHGNGECQADYQVATVVCQ